MTTARWARRVVPVIPALVLVGVVSALADAAHAQVDRRRDADAQRIEDATAVWLAMASSENGIPRTVLQKAAAVAVFPAQDRLPRRLGQGINTLRAERRLQITARGILSVRRDDGTWSSPAFVTMARREVPPGADLVLTIVEPAAVEQATRQVLQIEADTLFAAGPVGAAAAWTPEQQRARAFSYSQLRGVIAGFSLIGATLESDPIAHQRVYGTRLTMQDALAQPTVRDEARAWQLALARGSAR